MTNKPKTLPYPFSITSVCASGSSLLLGTYRNSDLNEPDNCIRSLEQGYKEIWKQAVEFSPARIAATPDQVLALTYNIYSSAGILYCLRRDSGELCWSKKLRSLSFSSELLVHNDCVLCVGDSETASYALKNGKRLSAVKHGSFFAPKVQGNSILCCSTRSLAKLSLDDLRLEWNVEGFDYLRAFGCNAKNAFVGDEEKLQLYDLKTGRFDRRISAGAYSAILCDQDSIFFQSEHDNGEKYVISYFTTAKQKPVWSTNVPISIDDARYSPQIELLTDKALVARANVGPVYALDRRTGKLTMLLSDTDMPDKRFPSQNSPVMFVFQNQLSIQYERVIYLLAEFPSALLGSTFLDADRESWKART